MQHPQHPTIRLGKSQHILNVNVPSDGPRYHSVQTERARCSCRQPGCYHVALALAYDEWRRYNRGITAYSLGGTALE